MYTTDPVQLDDRLLLATGGERDCYRFPNDENLIIKVVHSQKKHNEQNKVDFFYHKLLQRKGVDHSKITRCHGWIPTNKGKGLVFDRIHNYDNSQIRTYSFYTKHNLFSSKYDNKLLTDLKNYIFTNKILFVDVSLSNIFCQKIAQNEFTLIIFDGLGARRYGIKFWIYNLVPFLRNYKMKKQWKKLMQRYHYEKSLKTPLENSSRNFKYF